MDNNPVWLTNTLVTETGSEKYFVAVLRSSGYNTGTKTTSEVCGVEKGPEKIHTKTKVWITVKQPNSVQGGEWPIEDNEAFLMFLVSESQCLLCSTLLLELFLNWA